MKKGVLLLLVLVLVGCSMPRGNTIPTGTPVIVPTLSAFLTTECSQEGHDITPFIYAYFGYRDSACKLITFSHDGRYMAYATLANSTEVKGFNDTVRVLDVTTMAVRDVFYVLYRIDSLEWKSTGLLAVNTVSPDGALGWFVVYDPAAGRVAARIQGQVYPNSEAWSPDRMAVYLLFGAIGMCGHSLSGYDFISQKEFPDLQALFPDLQEEDMIMAEYPYIWENNRSLVFALKLADWVPEIADNRLTPSRIVRVDLSGDTPKLVVLKDDPAIDYSLMDTGGGAYRIIEQPYVEKYCYGWSPTPTP